MQEAAKPSKQRSKKVGLPPGSLVYIGQERTHKAHVSVIHFDGHGLTERIVATPDECLPLPETGVTWINVDAVHDSQLLGRFGELFQLHPLMLEDILNTEQRPKLEVSDKVIYIMAKMLEYRAGTRTIMSEQVSMVLGERWILTFQEELGDEFEPIRERLRAGSPRLRDSGPDYLAYALLDTMVDRYFLVLEQLGEELERLEDQMDSMQNLSPDLLRDMHDIKRELIFMRKTVWPMREVVSTLQNLDSPLMKPATTAYLRDVHDHAIQVIDSLETYRDLLSSAQDLYLSIISNRMNEVMKVLTVMSSIFIPLTFIVGVYGMNFRYMPELETPWAYPAVWVVMLVIALSLLLIFRRKRWL